MWILRIYQKREVLPGVYDARIFFRQYFVDEDADKAKRLADEINAQYKSRGYDDVYAAAAERSKF